MADLGRASTRDAFGRALLDVGRKDERIVLLAADCMGSCRATNFADEFPHRAFNFGIAEQQLMSAAAGFATCGFVPFVATFAMLISMRACEQVRTDIAYPRLNVKLIGTSGGVSMGAGGTTHHATEDIAILRSFPNMTVVVPADALETEKAIKAAVKHDGPVYLRLGRGDEPVIYDNEPDFCLGRAVTLREGTDVTLIGTGRMVSECLRAAESLDTQGISARVINMHTIKPLDEDVIEKAAAETRGIVTAEEHNVVGGLGEAVAAAAASRRPCRVLKVGFPDTFCAVGTQEELFDLHGLTPGNIAAAALQLMT